MTPSDAIEFKMIVFDGIIFSLQRTGGIGVYFKELLSRFGKLESQSELRVFDSVDIGPSQLQSMAIRKSKPRVLERYRPCEVPESGRLFHSSYYRLPSSPSIPLITTVHDFTYERFARGGRRWVHSWQKMAAIRSAHAIICISENTKQDLLKWAPNTQESRIFVVHNGVGHQFFPLARLQQSEVPYILFVGRRESYKNFTAAVAAVRSVPGLSLYCVGGGGFTSSELSFLARELPGRVRHWGDVSVERLNELYNAALCLLYPSSYEGFGIPILEAMSAGCPVIAVRASSIPEVAGNAAHLVDAPEPPLLAQAIEKLSNAGLRETLRRLGLQRAKGFSWNKTFNETKKIYEQVLGRDLP